MICLQTTCENLRLCVIVLMERIDWKHILGPHSAIIVSLPIAGFALPLQSMSHWNELLSTCSSVDEGFYCIGLCVFSKYVAGLTITSGNFDASGSTGDRPWLFKWYKYIIGLREVTDWVAIIFTFKLGQARFRPPQELWVSRVQWPVTTASRHSANLNHCKSFLTCFLRQRVL